MAVRGRYLSSRNKSGATVIPLLLLGEISTAHRATTLTAPSPATFLPARTLSLMKYPVLYMNKLPVQPMISPHFHHSKTGGVSAEYIPTTAFLTSHTSDQSPTIQSPSGASSWLHPLSQHHLHLPLQAQPPQQLRTDDALGPSSPFAPTSARACVSLNQNNPTAPTDLNPCSTQTAQSQSPEVPHSPPPVFWRFLEVLIVLVFPPPPGPLWCECTCDLTEPIRGFT